MDCLLGTHIIQDIFNIAIGIIEKRNSAVNFTALLRLRLQENFLVRSIKNIVFMADEFKKRFQF